MTTVESVNTEVAGGVVSEQKPGSSQVARDFARRWKKNSENKMKLKAEQLKNERKQRDVSTGNEVTQLITRKVPFEYLAKDWLEEQQVTLDIRAYLLENLIPVLVMGVERVLVEANKRNFIGKESINQEPFNPINFLAQFFMRNNPRYSNFMEASPYARSIKKLLDTIKEQSFDMASSNRLARLKLDARRRRDEEYHRQQAVFMVRKGRPQTLQNLFYDWTGDRKAVISLSLVQSALRSFQDYCLMLPVESQKDSMFDIHFEQTDVTGKLINVKEFVEYIEKHVGSLSDESFTEFITHMENLASEYRVSVEQEAMRVVLGNLFSSCDFGRVGMLDRQRILKLLCMFYDTAEKLVRLSLRDPRKWPVVEFEEEEDEVDKFNKKTEKLAVESLDNGTEDTTVKTQHDEIDGNDNRTDNSSFYETNEKKQEGRTAKPYVASVKQSPVRSPLLQQRSSEGSPIFSPARTSPNKSPLHSTSRSSAGTPVQKVFESDMEAYLSDCSDARGERKRLKHIDEYGEAQFSSLEINMEAEIKGIIEKTSSEISEPEAILGVSRPFSVTTAQAFDRASLNQNQFVSLLMTFLGEVPLRAAVESLVRFVRTGYVETDEERIIRMNKSKKEADNLRRRTQIEQLFELWDVDGSGYLEINEIEMVLSKWRKEHTIDRLLEQVREVFEDVFSKITKKSFEQMIAKVCNMFPNEDVFDSLIQFLTKSVQKSFEERKRGECRKKWLQAVDFSARTSGGLLEHVYKSVFRAISSDSEKHGRNKRISAHVAFLVPNHSENPLVKGDRVLKYVASTPNDHDLLLNCILHRGMKCVSFTAVDTEKPIHVPRVLSHGGVYIWNPIRKEEKIDGSFICLPLKDYEKQVTGVLGIDTLADPHDKATFATHEISFYQGLAKALSQAVQYVELRQKTIKISESAVSWILRRSPNVHEVTIYLAEPALKASDGSVLRRMVTLGHNYYEKPEFSPRLERKDNLFRDYLFKCIDTSETLTADAYGERHLAFPLRDADGLVASIVDISIGNLRQLPQHELEEIHRMLKLLGIAHKEVTNEDAGEDKNMVLEIEKEHQNSRIEVLFDRIMLQDLRTNVGRLDARAFAEIKSYKDPPKIIHDILKAVLGLFLNGEETEEIEEKLSEWTSTKQLVNNDLVKWITSYDPTASNNLAVGGTKLAGYLADILPGAVAKQGSLPAQYLFNWAFVCLSLIEHTNKMRVVQKGGLKLEGDGLNVAK